MQERFISLLYKYLTDSINLEERSELCALVQSGSYDQLLERLIDEKINDGSFTGKEDMRLKEIGFGLLEKRIYKEEMILLTPVRPIIHLRKRLRYAAVIILLIFSAAIYFFFSRNPQQTVMPACMTVNISGCII